MSGLRAGRRRTVASVAPLVLPSLAEKPEEALAAVERALGEVSDAVNGQLGRAYVADVELVVGANTIAHGLGRKPGIVRLTPKSADASFAWAWDPAQAGNATPTRTTVVDVVGVSMTARIEVE